MSSYIRGAGIFAIGGIIAKLLGLFFKIPIGRILDNFGFGLYYNSYNIYNLLLTISIVGVPVAISKMIAERASVRNHLGVYKVFKLSFLLLSIIGAISSAILYFGANWIIGITGWHTDTYYAIVGLALAPFFVSIMCAIRGFFQGLQLMKPSAISQIIEAITRVVFGISLCWFWTKNYGQAEGAGGASAGATIAAIITTGFLLFALYAYLQDFKEKIKRSKTYNKRESSKAIMKRLIQIALPVTLASAVVSLFGMVNSSMYVPRLAIANISKEQATSMFGDFGLSQTMVNVPLTFSTAMSATLVPAISASYALRDKAGIQRKTELSLRVMMLISLPCAVGLSIFSEEIFNLMFPNAVYGGTILKFLAWSVILIMISNTLQSILQAIDNFTIPVINLIIALVVKYVLNYIFMAIPSINIHGLVISNIGAYFVSTVLNYLSLKRFVKFRLSISKTFIKPIVACAIMAFVGKSVYKGLFMLVGNNISILIAILISATVYFIALLLMGGLSKEELSIIPGGRKIAGRLK